MRRPNILLAVVAVSTICALLPGFGLAFTTTSHSHLTRHMKERATRISVGRPVGRRQPEASWRLNQASGSNDVSAEADDDDADEADTPKPWEPKKGNFIDRVKAWFGSEEGKEDLRIYGTSLVVALIIRFLIIEPRFIPSLSMYPTFDVGDQLAVEKVTKRIRPFNRNEVVVFSPPETFREILGEGNKRSREALIKRIVAVEGDKVEVTGGKLVINGKAVDEPFKAEDAQYEFGPVVVPKGTVLVLGDNRNHSLDGHIWGFLPKENVIGRAVFIYWPPWRFGNEYLY